MNFSNQPCNCFPRTETNTCECPTPDCKGGCSFILSNTLTPGCNCYHCAFFRGKKIKQSNFNCPCPLFLCVGSCETIRNLYYAKGCRCDHCIYVRRAECNCGLNITCTCRFDKPNIFLLDKKKENKATIPCDYHSSDGKCQTESSNNKRKIEPLDFKEEEGSEETSKKIKTEDGTIIEEIDEWFGPKFAATLTVHVKTYMSDKDYKRYQTGIVHAHCVPGILATHSKWFEATLETEPNVKEIDMPMKFSYHAVRKRGSGGEINVLPSEVVDFFKILHSLFDQTLLLEKARDSTAFMLMSFYVDMPVLFLKVTQGKVWHKDTSPIIKLLWADYFNSTQLFNETCEELKYRLKDDRKCNRKNTLEDLQDVPSEILHRALVTIFCGPE